MRISLNLLLFGCFLSKNPVDVFFTPTISIVFCALRPSWPTPVHFIFLLFLSPLPLFFYLFHCRFADNMPQR